MNLLVALHPIDGERVPANSGGVGTNGNQLKVVKGAPSAQEIADIIKKFPEPSNTAFYANLSELDKLFDGKEPKIKQQVAKSIMKAFDNPISAEYFSKKISDNILTSGNSATHGAKFVEIMVKYPELNEGIIKGSLSDKKDGLYQEFKELGFDEPDSCPYNIKDKEALSYAFTDPNSDRMAIGRKNEANVTTQMKEQRRIKKGPLYDKLKAEFAKLNGKNLDDYTHFTQLKLCYTKDCGPGEYTMIDDAYLHKNGNNVDVIICDTKLTKDAPWTSNQQNNIDLLNGTACTTNRDVQLNPPPIYSIKGNDKKKGSFKGEDDEYLKEFIGVKNPTPSYPNPTINISAVLKLECNGSANGIVTNIINVKKP